MTFHYFNIETIGIVGAMGCGIVQRGLSLTQSDATGIHETNEACR